MRKLAFCIPTHHGRAEFLRQLIESILRQQESVDAAELQICVSDNASADETARMIAQYQQSSAIPIKYHRFETDMRGVINTTNVMEMADAEFCWLLGSDDVILPGAAARVLKAFDENKQAGGVTVNKLNYDRSLEILIGPDHRIILPDEPSRSRLLDGVDDILFSLGLPFSYMSAHIVRRQSWLEVVRRFGIEYLKSTRHFSHAFIFAHIARAHGAWFWIGDIFVIQRMGNFCLLQEKDDRTSLYAMEILEDISMVWSSVLDVHSREYRSLMRRHFIVSWNPFAVRKFKMERGLTPQEERRLLGLAVKHFGHSALFRVTSYPILFVPAPLFRRLRLVDAVFAHFQRRQIGLRPIIRSIWRMFGVENEWTRQHDRRRELGRRLSNNSTAV